MPDCIALTEPVEDHCPVHIREVRAALRGRRCAVDRCVRARDGGDTLCSRHREEALISLARAATGPAAGGGTGPAADGRVRRWNTG
ncbi:hypothetical protein ACFPZ0_21350 [Streptomonospora nanhaiensis]|uniref:Uncharacterized protein n=1 Tax=Streptomonospora nanhaiensis TaxID=1323731 RepID=A0A853BQC7_9ACTN|nr:hypothetical protein [Streptomonospora nanhaiensis]MBV2364325.1 hypothetical protein [Streptomonospora nanhaiensis]MBX9390580.1 hypothetical protein [Streptomonospora nanhaiensis]NYI97210.1 hypothetical protein [Streptomonospora nanhaiensis]